MKTIKEIWKMTERSKLLSYFLLGLATAICDFLFINSIANVVGKISSKNYTVLSKDYIAVFLLLIFLIVWTRKASSSILIKISQKLLWNYRKSIISKILKSNFEQLSKNKIKVLNALVNDVNVLSSMSANVVGFFTSTIMSIACMIYLCFISKILFLITLIITLGGCVIYYYGSKKSAMYFDASRHLENDFFKNFKSILDGYKEIFMNPLIGKSIYANKIVNISENSYKSNVAAYTHFLKNQITGLVLFYTLLTFIILYFSVTLKIPPSDIVRFVFVLMYLFTSIQAIMVLLPGFLNAKIASDHLLEVQNELETLKIEDVNTEIMFEKYNFKNISISNLVFQYGNDISYFKIGPIDFNLKRGNITFIYGGNGCGKTTFINTLLGLLTPTDGQIILNDQLVTQKNRADYRSVFSFVSSDFFLFDEIHGVEEIDLEQWRKYLKIFELEGKVFLDGRKYSVTDLSTGQRKRLALVTALLENKPVLVLDEWAADQDPIFRKKFYTEIIPFFKTEKRAVLAITHDDKYYNCADDLYKMVDGKLIKKELLKVVIENKYTDIN